MYIRQLKQFLRGVDAAFDERKYGFETLGDLMRACQRDGLLRIERDRQGGMRIFPGTLTPAADAAGPHTSLPPAPKRRTPTPSPNPLSRSSRDGCRPSSCRARRRSSRAPFYRKLKCRRSSTRKKRPRLPTGRPAVVRARRKLPGLVRGNRARRGSRLPLRVGRTLPRSAPAGSKTRKSAGRPKTTRSRTRSDVSQE